MKKRILSILLIVVTMFTLVACYTDGPVDDYISNDAYETAVMDSHKKVKDTSVNISTREGIFSGVIVDKQMTGKENIYIALTHSDAARNFQYSEVSFDRNKNKSRIINSSYNNNYNIGLITFRSSRKLKVADFMSDDKNHYSVNMGQTVVSNSANVNDNVTNSFRTGNVSSVNVNKYSNNTSAFMHNTPINYGEIGSGVYNLYGQLIGLNIEKEYNQGLVSSAIGTVAMNHAIGLEDFVNLYNNVDIRELSSEIPSSSFKSNSSLTGVEYEATSYEKKISEIYNDNYESVVRINTGYYGSISGSIISKARTSYSVLTIHLDESFVQIYTSDNELHESTRVKSYNGLFSIVTFTSLNEYKILNSKSINTGVSSELVVGQKVLTIGAYRNSNFGSLHVGSLSKKGNSDDNTFMHDSSLNRFHNGAPIFNLDGELIGIHTKKLEKIITETGEILAEGLNTALNVSQISTLLNGQISQQTVKYTSKIGYEMSIIDVYKKVKDVVVTVSTDVGHGSGIIFKKELKKKGEFLYSALTNHHVVDGASEASIRVDSLGNIYTVEDYASNSINDVAIVRFTSKDDLTVLDQKVLNDKHSINSYTGQTVVAVGSPESTSNFSYLTTGTVTSPVETYGIIRNLSLPTSVTINPGNSGGPLFNLNGELIGLNVSKITGFNTIEGVVFAERISASLNVNILKEVISKIKKSDFKKFGKAEPRLGLSMVDKAELIIYPEEYAKIASEYDGVVVMDVSPSSDAFLRILPYDLISEINGVRVNYITDVKLILAGVNEGESVQIVLHRKMTNGQTETLTEYVVYK